MAERKETILELPWEIADSCNGFGMDFGKKCYISDVLALVSYCIHCNIILVIRSRSFCRTCASVVEYMYT